MLRFRTVVPRSRYSAAAAAKSISKPSIPSQNTGDTDKEQRIESFFSSFNAERQRMEKDRRESLKRLQESLHTSNSQRPDIYTSTRVKWRRRFFPGDSYEPEDLATDESPDRRRGKMNKRPLFEGDVLTANGIDIDAEYKNIALLSTFINNIGQVLPTRKTGISRESQYRVVKAINRAVAFGIIPKTRKHWSLTPRE